MAGTAEEIAAKWVRNIGSSVESVRAGVNRVTTSPTQQAAAAADLWQQRTSSQDAKDKFRRNLGRVSLEDWKNAMLNKGVNRIATGASAAQTKMAAFLAEFLPFVNNVAQQVRGMPKATLDDRINRMVAQVRGNAQFRRSR